MATNAARLGPARDHLCVRCGARAASWQHRVAKGRGGPTDRSNCLPRARMEGPRAVASAGVRGRPYVGRTDVPESTTCTVDGCDREKRARGWCSRHYAYWHKYRRPPIPPAMREPDARFDAKVDRSDPAGCWLWTGSLRAGYGRFWVDGTVVQAHRYAYERVVGPIPADRELDHLCRIRRCVNPDHLDVVTPSENVRRSPIHPSVARTPTRDPLTGRFIA